MANVITAFRCQFFPVGILSDKYKMAIICVACFPKRSLNFILLRLLKQTYCEQKSIQSSSKSLVNNRDVPIKFTTNKASTITISETTGLLREKSKGTYTIHIACASMAVFLLYFCALREENDIDEILKGNINSEDDRIKLVNLKIQLKYCENNKLPTEPVKAKIRELEEKQQKIPAFVK